MSKTITHHSIRVRVTGLRNRKALDDFRCHPRKCPHQRHVGGVGMKLRCPEIADLMGNIIIRTFLKHFFEQILEKTENMDRYLEYFICRQDNCEKTQDVFS